MSRRGVALIVLLVVLVVLIGWLGGREGGPRPRFPSAFAAEPEGILGFRRLLEQLDVPVSLRTTPWDDLQRDGTNGLMIVALPFQRSVDAAEASSLDGWIRAGNALLVVDDATAGERSGPLDDLLDANGLGGRVPPFEPDFRWTPPQAQRPKRAEVAGTPLPPSDPGWTALGLHAEGSDLFGELTALPLAIDDDARLLAAEARLGEGRIVRVLGPLLANDALLEGDNLGFALNLVGSLRDGRRIHFDEFHHGYGGLLAATRIDARVLWWTVGQSLLVALLYGWARGARFGPPRVFGEVQRRSTLEFVHSMASLYRRAGAGRHVLDVLHRRLRRDARQRYGLGESLALPDFAAQLSARTGVDTERIIAALDRPATTGPIDDRETLRRARLLAAVQEEVFGEHPARG